MYRYSLSLNQWSWWIVTGWITCRIFLLIARNRLPKYGRKDVWSSTGWVLHPRHPREGEDDPIVLGQICLANSGDSRSRDVHSIPLMIEGDTLERHPRWSTDRGVKHHFLCLQRNTTPLGETELHQVRGLFDYLSCVAHNERVFSEAGYHGKSTNFCLIDYIKS